MCNEYFDAFCDAESKYKKLVEALTPSKDTKISYIGEFSFFYPIDNEEEVISITVPWITIKEIMKKILEKGT